jgi:hypothetical protein
LAGCLRGHDPVNFGLGVFYVGGFWEREQVG